MQEFDIVIIGPSAEGVNAAITARRNYPGKSITVIRKEKLVPIPCGILYAFGVVGTPEKKLIPLLFKAASQVIIGGQVSGAKSGGELINTISACIHQRMTADDIATFQTGTHPALTASPIAYQLVNTAEMAISSMKSRK